MVKLKDIQGKCYVSENPGSFAEVKKSNEAHNAEEHHAYQIDLEVNGNDTKIYSEVMKNFNHANEMVSKQAMENVFGKEGYNRSFNPSIALPGETHLYEYPSSGNSKDADEYREWQSACISQGLFALVYETEVDIVNGLVAQGKLDSVEAQTGLEKAKLAFDKLEEHYNELKEVNPSLGIDNEKVPDYQKIDPNELTRLGYLYSEKFNPELEQTEQHQDNTEQQANAEVERQAELDKQAEQASKDELNRQAELERQAATNQPEATPNQSQSNEKMYGESLHKEPETQNSPSEVNQSQEQEQQAQTSSETKANDTFTIEKAEQSGQLSSFSPKVQQELKAEGGSITSLDSAISRGNELEQKQQGLQEKEQKVNDSVEVVSESSEAQQTTENSSVMEKYLNEDKNSSVMEKYFSEDNNNSVMEKYLNEDKNSSVMEKYLDQSNDVDNQASNNQDNNQNNSQNY